MNKVMKKIWERAIAMKTIKEEEVEESEDEDEDNKKKKKDEDEGEKRVKYTYTLAPKDDEVLDESGDEGKSVPSVPGPITYDCRLFNYKKKSPSDYNYIKTKYTLLSYFVFGIGVSEVMYSLLAYLIYRLDLIYQIYVINIIYQIYQTYILY